MEQRYANLIFSFLFSFWGGPQKQLYTLCSKRQILFSPFSFFFSLFLPFLSEKGKKKKKQKKLDNFYFRDLPQSQSRNRRRETEEMRNTGKRRFPLCLQLSLPFRSFAGPNDRFLFGAKFLFPKRRTSPILHSSYSTPPRYATLPSIYFPLPHPHAHELRVPLPAPSRLDPTLQQHYSNSIHSTSLHTFSHSIPPLLSTLAPMNLSLELRAHVQA